MANKKYYAFSGECPAPDLGAYPEDAVVNAVTIDGSIYPGCIFGSVQWLVKPFTALRIIKHDSDELHMFIGGDTDKPEKLNAVIEFTVENDVLTLTDTCFVYVPAGAAHGNIKVVSMDRPVMHFLCHMNKDHYEVIPAEVTAPKGKYADYKVERYARADGTHPKAPKGFLKLLLWIDGKRFSGAPYTEAVWFCTNNDTGPVPHVHDNLDELIGFVGNDPYRPDDLGAAIQVNMDDMVISCENKPCLIYVPRNVRHSPILVPSLTRPVVHFTGGNGGDYNKNTSGNQ